MITSYVRVKICGITTSEDARMVADSGVDAIGLNFYSKSSRFVSVESSREIVRSLPPFVSSTGVFVDTSDDDIKRIATEIGLGAVQTYDERCLHCDFSPTAHIPAFRVKERADLDSIRGSVSHCLSRIPGTTSLRAILVDSFVAGEMGGTGRTAPWDLIAELISSIEGERLPIPVILAGGLTPDNVAEAIRVVRPWGVDVAGGVEIRPGLKDAGKVRAFVTAVREASANLDAPFSN